VETESRVYVFEKKAYINTKLTSLSPIYRSNGLEAFIQLLVDLNPSIPSIGE
jgi:hypothetical protein